MRPNFVHLTCFFMAYAVRLMGAGFTIPFSSLAAEEPAEFLKGKWQTTESLDAPFV